MEDTITTTIRISDNDYKKLKIIAQNEDRSVNSQMISVLKSYIKKYESENGTINISED